MWSICSRMADINKQYMSKLNYYVKYKIWIWTIPLNIIGNYMIRKWLTWFLLGSHRLEIELGRITGIDRENRCKLCNSNVETEYHVVLCLINININKYINVYSQFCVFGVRLYCMTVETEWHVCGLVNNNEKPNRSLWKCNIYKAAKVVSKRLIHLPFLKYLSVKNNINLFDSTANECAAPNFVWRSIVWPFLGS